LPSQYSKNVHYLNKIILRSNEAFAIFNWIIIFLLKKGSISNIYYHQLCNSSKVKVILIKQINLKTN
jgi:hypothetical protein